MIFLNFHIEFVIFACIVSCYNVLSEKAIDHDLTITWEQKLILDKIVDPHGDLDFEKSKKWDFFKICKFNFRERVAEGLPHEYMKNELFLVRFLRANDFDIPLAEEHLINHLQWRKDFKMDSIQNEDWSDFKILFPYWIEGHDKEGKPILYYSFAETDIRSTVFAGQSYQFLRYILKSFDELCIKVRKLSEEGRNITQGIMIVNTDEYDDVLHGCLRCMQVLLKAAKSIKTQFHGCFQKFIVLNVRQRGEPMFEAYRRTVSLTSAESTRFFTKSKSKWMPYLLKYIDLDQLPLEIGGTKVYPGLDEDFDAD